MARVFLHVGGPKTGTTFLQAVLWRQADVALRQGLLLPFSGVPDHYRAYLDLTGHANWKGVPGEATGTWSRLLEEIAAHPGDALVSTEFFVHASAQHAARAVADLTGLGREVHVVVTVRDLARFLPSQWQETIKSTRSWTFAEFLRQAREASTPEGRAQRRLWDYPALLQTWAQGVPPERVHVVTVAPPPASRTVLWQRFASVLGLDAGEFSLDIPRTNGSLGAEQAEVLRRVNAALAGRVGWPAEYQQTVQRPFLRRVLAAREGGPPITIPADELAWVRAESARIVAALASSGVDVVGDLADLHVDDRQPAPTAPDLGPQRVGEEAVAVLAELLLQRAAATERHQARTARLRKKLAVVPPQPEGRVRRLARRVSGRGPVPTGGTG